METGELILLLMATPEIGEKKIGTVLRRTAVSGLAPISLLTMSPTELASNFGIPESSAALIQNPESPARSHAALLYRNLTRAGARIVTILDASYPHQLIEHMADPPTVLFAYGNQLAVEGPLFAVANSEGASEEALAAGDRAAEILLQAGFTLVTGHNRTAYQRPALVMRRNGGRVCYILDRGIVEAFGGDLTRALFPAARIWGPAYDPDCDLTISPFAPDAHCIGANNRRRDSIIFALADLIVAGDVRSGGRMEAECALALSRGIPVLIAQIDSPAAGLLVERGAKTLQMDALSGIAAQIGSSFRFR